MFKLNPDFIGQLLVEVKEAIEIGIIPAIQADTRVDTGEMRDSTRVEIDAAANELVLIQGGTPECDYAVWIEFRYGDFSRQISEVDWNFKS